LTLHRQQPPSAATSTNFKTASPRSRSARSVSPAPIPPLALPTPLYLTQSTLSQNSRKPHKAVISILHGITYGLALDISLATDIRLSAASTAFCIKEIDIGLAADIGTLSRLPKAVGSLSWVKDVCLTARVFGAEEALRVGLVSGVYGSKAEAVEKGVEIAKLIGGKSPVAVQGTKEIVNYSRDRGVEEGE